MSTPPVDHAGVPYRIAVLVHLTDGQGRRLLLHRTKEPNAGMHSPVGGKLEVEDGESPHTCAVREVHEETGIVLQENEVHLLGMVSERSYENTNHWLIFVYEVTRTIDPGEITSMTMDEGELKWVNDEDIEHIGIPDTDREILWPQVKAHSPGGFFVVHIECGGDTLVPILHQSHPSS